jgi:hypothetical protein
MQKPTLEQHKELWAVQDNSPQICYSLKWSTNICPLDNKSKDNTTLVIVTFSIPTAT